MKITIELDAKEFADLTAETAKPAENARIIQILQDQLDVLVNASKSVYDEKNLPGLTNSMVRLAELVLRDVESIQSKS